MDITNKTIWQQSCGDTDRNYSEVCLKWDVILNGPGYPGAWPECVKTLKEHRWKFKKITDLRRFAEEMKDGDLVVLRLGTKQILGVGIIVDDYGWSDVFRDIDGWDLQHYRRVRWVWKSVKNFKTYTLKQGDTTQILSSQTVSDWLESLNVNEEAFNRELVMLRTKNTPRVSHEEIADHLYNQGVSSNSIENLLHEFNELQRIAKWYSRSQNPSEHETVAYLVVPLLRAIGWTPQKMAIEWKKVDIALFESLPRDNNNLSIVVEVKRKGNACLMAKSQAESYAHGRPNCNRIIVTDGIRFGFYLKSNGKFELTAYMNLTDLRASYPIYECGGVKDSLTMITPEWALNYLPI